MKLKPFFAIITFLLTCACFAQKSEKNTAVYNGNTITFKQFGLDTFELEDPVTGEITIKLEKHLQPYEINGKHIFRNQESSEPLGDASQKNLNSFLKSYLSSELEAVKLYCNYLELVINEKGDLAYLDINLRKIHFRGSCSTELSDAKESEVKNSITEKLNTLKFTPAKKDGKVVPYYFVMN